MEYIPVALFWMLAIWAFLSRGPALLYLFFASMPFGAFAAVPTVFTAGLTFTATPLVCVLLILRTFLARDGLDSFVQNAISAKRLGLLFGFWIVAILATIFLPRLFADTVAVMPMRDIKGGVKMVAPSAQNVSQAIYVSISILTVFAFAKILRSPVDRQHALKAMLFGGAVTVLTGLVDFASQYVPLEPLLAVFRTASYSLAVDVEVLGSKRVVGLMPEASAFGEIVLGFLCGLVFFRRAIGNARLRKVYAPVVILLLCLCVYLSTSSGTYVGFALLVVLVAAEAALRAFTGGQSRRFHRQDLTGELGLVLVLFVLAVLCVMFVPVVTESVYALVDRMVLSKTETGSFEERGMWRALAVESVFASNGLGIGLGSTRASSSLAAIFSGTGILGGMLYLTFVLQSLLRKSSHLDLEGQFMLTAFRFSFIPPFVVSLMVGGSDFGPMMAFGFGMVTAVSFSKASQMALRRETALIAQRRSQTRGGERLALPGPATRSG